MRKLVKDRDLSFRQQKEDCRRQWLQNLLKEPTLTIEDILGYDTPSDFSRACKSWTGRMPRQHRNLLAKAQASLLPRLSGKTTDITTQLQTKYTIL